MLARIGPLDEAILNDPHHVDFCMMVREAGGSIYLEPAALVTQIAPPPVQWSDLAFFLQRWNEPATRQSLRRFTRKWRLSQDDPAVQELAEWLVDRRKLAFRGLHGAVKRVVGWRIGSRLERACLVPLEAAVSGMLFYALRDQGAPRPESSSSARPSEVSDAEPPQAASWRGDGSIRAATRPGAGPLPVRALEPEIEGQSIYLINRFLKGLVRYSIRSGGVDVIPLPRQARPPQDTDLETYLAFVLGFDVSNNAMLLYGGKNGTDVGLPQVYWLYRYGSGSGGRRANRQSWPRRILPAGLLGSASRNSMRAGTLKSARRSLQ